MKKVKLLYGDKIIIALLCFLSLVLFLLPVLSQGELKAEVYLDGELVHTAYLSSVSESYEFETGGCILIFEGGGVSFKSSECPDKLCVNRGKLKRSGDTMACVPERVTVTLKSEKGKAPDGVTF